ncbi:SAM-dependent methyltransferase [Streptomyces desertarenae]|uniref:SAM-dependent methyltransferase n=1 Tax=Streptomyces desertarenae TaxID=2666184 RepID=A0ABW4PKU0_9ACTN
MHETGSAMGGHPRQATTPGTSSARLYDAFAGGKDNYASDEEIAGRILKLWPEVRQGTQANRGFIHRSARWLAAEAGISQFLDIGTGIPSPASPHLHTTVQDIDPAARVLYTDNDPVVLAHAAALLTGTPQGRTSYLDADATDPDSILGSRELADTLDLDRPVAVYLCALLHLVGDDQDPKGIVRRLADAVVPGSYVVISHATTDYAPELMARFQEIYNQGRAQCAIRSGEEILDMVEGLELVDPGMVPIHRWRPETDDLMDDSKINGYALVARKP